MSFQHRKKVPTHRNKNENHYFHHSNNLHNNNHHNSNNKQQQQQQQQNLYQQPKKQTISISDIKEYAKSVIYGSLDYPIPNYCLKSNEPHKFNELPTFKERPVAKLTSTILGSTYQETVHGAFKTKLDFQDPAVKITTSKKSNATIFKLGGNEIDITTKYNVLNNSNNTGKLVNKFLQNDSLGGTTTTPLKRIRDEIVEASSSVKKNKRLQELQQDTTMELSFEGKAMDKNDYVRLVDSSGIMADDSNILDSNPQQNNYDTKNLLQSTEFSFEYKR